MVEILLLCFSTFVTKGLWLFLFYVNTFSGTMEFHLTFVLNCVLLQT